MNRSRPRGRTATIARLLLIAATIGVTLSLNGGQDFAQQDYRAAASLPIGQLPAQAQAAEQTNQDCRLDPAIDQMANAPDIGSANYLHTCGSTIYDRYGREFDVLGVNWFGLETAWFSPVGLELRNWQNVMDEIAAKGYNTVRLPFSNETLEPQRHPLAINYHLNPDLRGLTALELIDKIVEGARQRGLRVILDRHRPTALGQQPLWYSSAVSEQRWIEDWQMLARRYLGDDTVIGIDLNNEPHGIATWGTGDPYTDWRLAAEKGGDAVLAVNPYLLILVQGIEIYQGDYYWWGAQLTPAGAYPVNFSVPNRLVYSPRDYGPEVYEQAYFKDPKFPANLVGVWDRHWGYLQKQGIAPVVLGEYGASSWTDPLTSQWQQISLEYVFTNRIGFVVWHLDRSVWSKSGALTNVWAQYAQSKQNLAKGYLLSPGLSEALRGLAKRRQVLTQATYLPNCFSNWAWLKCTIVGEP